MQANLTMKVTKSIEAAYINRHLSPAHAGDMSICMHVREDNNCNY